MAAHRLGLYGSAVNVLVVAAHPDDEILGCGGTIAKHVHEGDAVVVACLADGVTSRDPAADHSSELARRRAAGEEAAAVLGISKILFGGFPDNRMDSVPILEAARTVESLLEQHRPTVVYTHHGGDLNVDHRRTHQAVVTACRPQPHSTVTRLLFFETASSTEWQVHGGGAAFEPNWFVDVSSTLAVKLRALQAYGDELREWPHARSAQAVEHLARWRGSIIGRPAAEAFMVGRGIA
jgi:LmbE family N-acetylglucosaminyl deacetylase